MPIDPQLRRMLGALSLAPASASDLAGRRAAFRRLMAMAERCDAAVELRDYCVTGASFPLVLRLYSPSSARGLLPGLVYLHGGGFVCGDLATHDALCRAICAASGCRIVAVDYRLAPEHRYPAALEDAEAAILWTISQAAALEIDPARIGIGGDSAGATLAAAVARKLARSHSGCLALQFLLCPILDWAGAIAGAAETANPYLIDADTMAQELELYLPPGVDARDPAISPLRSDEWYGLPPALIHTAEFDPVCETGNAYADRLRAAGVAVRSTCHYGMTHLFYGFGQWLPYARIALQHIGAELGAALRGDFSGTAEATSCAVAF